MSGLYIDTDALAPGLPERGLEMMLAAQLFWEGALFLTAGVVLGYWFFRWKQRKHCATRVAEEKSLLESAHREVEAILREARLALPSLSASFT